MLAVSQALRIKYRKVKMSNISDVLTTSTDDAEEQRGATRHTAGLLPRGGVLEVCGDEVYLEMTAGIAPGPDISLS